MIIKEVELHTADLDKAEEFYHHLLGFQIIKKDTTSISFAVGYSVLSFVLNKKNSSFYHFAFLIPSNKLQEAYDWINKRTTVLPYDDITTIADFKNWNAHAFYFHDHQQNILECIAHHDLNNNSDQKFSSSSIIGVCEIGVTVDDVSDASTNFNTAYKIPYYIKGPQLHDFAVMGEEDGLLIISKKGRGWLPTQRPAEKFYSRIVLENNGIINELKILQ